MNTLMFVSVLGDVLISESSFVRQPPTTSEQIMERLKLVRGYSVSISMISGALQPAFSADDANPPFS